MSKFKFLSCLLLSSLILGVAANKYKPADQKELEKIIKDNKDKPVVAEFFATWCGHCKTFDKHLEDVAKENQDIAIIQVDVDKFKNLSQDFGVQGMPTSFLLESGKELKPENKFEYSVKDTEGNQQKVDSVIGADKKKLEDSIGFLTGKKKASDIVVPAMPKMPAQPQQAMGPLDGIGMYIQQLLGEDLMKELSGKLPEAIEKFMQSDKVGVIVDKLADVASEAVADVIGYLDINNDIKSKLIAKLAEAKKAAEDNFKMVEPMIKKINPNAHKVALSMNKATTKVLEGAHKAAAKKQATSVEETKSVTKPATKSATKPIAA